jgi:hypothetical protein
MAADGKKKLSEKERERRRTARAMKDFDLFLSEACILGDYATRANVLLAAFRKWKGNDEMSAQMLAVALYRKEFGRYISNGSWWVGLGVRDEIEKSINYPISEFSELSEIELILQRLGT